MDKERVVLDLEPGLRGALQDRLALVHERWKVTGVLRVLIYHLLMSTNDELKALVSSAVQAGSDYKEYMKIVEEAIEQNIFDEDFNVINTNMAEYHEMLTEIGADPEHPDEPTYELNMFNTWEYIVENEEKSFWDTPAGHAKLGDLNPEGTDDEGGDE